MPPGTGKTTIAKIFAKAINCENNIDGNPCNKCNSCINLFNSNDVIEIDAASNNGVDEIRDLREKATLVPSICKYKVYIIDEVHMLTMQAFNALLKILEEPPKHVIFILATTEYHKIPLTITSRCQKFQFNKLEIDDIVKRLREISDLEKIESELLVHHLSLEKKPHVGVWIQGAKEDKIALFLNVDQQNDIANTYSKDYRIGCMLVQILLGNSKIYPDKFADELYVSRSTIEKDLSAVSKWLEKHQLELSRNANNGLYVKGSEENIRNAVGSLANDLNTRNLSIESFLETYLNVDFKKIEDIVSEWNEKYGMNLNEMNINNLAFHASIMVIRILKNKELEMSDCDELQEESHSYKEEFEQLIYELSEYIHSDIPKAESNYLLMHLFGMYLNEPAFIKNDFLSELRTLAENISDDFICNLDKIVALNLKQNKIDIGIVNQKSHSAKLPGKVYPSCF